MPIHISARLAWHDDGWNGHVCKKPAENSYCVGRHSYPGQLIGELRNLNAELPNAGKPCAFHSNDSTDGYIPPCCFSANAFGKDAITAYADPPVFFKDETKRRYWNLSPSTICVWPYEEMYNDDVKQGAGYDYKLRQERANKFFSALEKNKSLIFYYANYSNPFSEDEKQRYVLVGLSRLKHIGDEIMYDDCSERVRERYVGYVWQRPIESHYPVQGLRIPYHVYRNDPDTLNRILLKLQTLGMPND